MPALRKGDFSGDSWIALTIMKHFLIALQFLTVLPVKLKGAPRDKDFAKSLLYFPLVGMIIAAVLWLGLRLLAPLPGLVKAAALLALSAVITGGLHLDGFMDTCDGFYGFASPQERRRIMRDSAVGAMGVAGGVCLLLFKFTLLASLPPALLGKALVLTFAFSRWAIVVGCFLGRYPYDEGSGKRFIAGARLRELIGAGVFTFALFLWWGQVNGILIFGLSLLGALGFIKYARAKIGGMTGDTLGALNEVGETGVLLICLLLLR